MTKFAWVENDIIRDVCAGDPAKLFHPDVAAHYSTQVGNQVEKDWRLVNGTWTAPEPIVIDVTAIEIPTSPVLTVNEFKLRFTSQERVAINGLVSTDPLVQDFWSIVNDARTMNIDTSDSNTTTFLLHLQSENVLTAERVSAITAPKTTTSINQIPSVVA